MVDIWKNTRYNILDFGVWRSLVSRLVRVQEASGSNPDTPTNRKSLVTQCVSRLFLFSMNLKIRSETPKAHKKSHIIDILFQYAIIILFITVAGVWLYRMIAKKSGHFRATVSRYVGEYEAATRTTAYVLNAKANT